MTAWIVLLVQAIDPGLIYSTYLGGRGMENMATQVDFKAAAIGVNAQGYVYLTGNTTSTDFPSRQNNNSDPDVFVVKLDASGSRLVYATILGGSGIDRGFGIAVDGAGNAYVTGRTQSPDFPTRRPLQAALRGNEDGFVAKLGPDGSLIYSTYLGGNSADDGFAIAVGADGSAYITGETQSFDFPVVNATQPRSGGGRYESWVARLAPDGASLEWSTYLGGAGEDDVYGIALDSSGNVHVVGHTNSRAFPLTNPSQSAYGGGDWDGFVVKYSPTGARLYSTFFGGSGMDIVLGVAIDPSGRAWITGITDSPNLAGSAPSDSDAFLARLDPTGAVGFSKLFGGNGVDAAFAVAVDSAGNVWVTGATDSDDLPVTPGAFQPALRGRINGFLVKLDSSGRQVSFATYYGGSSEDLSFGLAVDPAGHAFITGATSSRDLPVTPGAFQTAYGGGPTDGFVARIGEAGARLVTASAASFAREAPLAAESIVSSFGDGLASDTSAAVSVPLPTILAGTSVRVTDSGGTDRLAPLFFVSPRQINYLIPAGTAQGNATVTVLNGDRVAAAGTLRIEHVAPGLFTANADGRGVAAAVALRISASGAQTTAAVFQCPAPGSCTALPIDLGAESDQVVLLLFGTGIRGFRSAVTARIGGVEAPVLGAAAQAEFAGLDQVNVRLLRSLGGRGEVDLVLAVDGVPANTVRLSVR